MSVSEKIEVLQAELDTAIAEILRLKRVNGLIGKPVATTKADHAVGEIGYVEFHAEVPYGTELYIQPAQLGQGERVALLRDAYEDGFRDGDRCHERGDHFGEAMKSGWLASDAHKALSASAEPNTQEKTPQ